MGKGKKWLLMTIFLSLFREALFQIVKWHSFVLKVSLCGLKDVILFFVLLIIIMYTSFLLQMFCAHLCILCFITYYCVSSVYLTLKIKIAFFFKKSLWNVWCVLKKCLPLHPLSERKHVFKEEFFDRFRYKQASSTGL